ncbi:MAG: glycosyltransferase family 2 protein [Nitrospirota bacterium]
MPTNRLSVALITYNEEANIRRTLESVKWADEIVVLDSGSTDKTIEICREFTDNVFHQEWHGFATQKNSAIDTCTGDWILSLDADEPIEPELAEEIRTLISSSNSHDGYWIPRRTFFLGKEMKHGGWYPDYNLRLFKKGKGRFQERAVHESIYVNGSIGKTKNAILHYAYPDLTSYIASINKYSSLSVDVMSARAISTFRTSCVNIIFRPVLTFFHKYIIRGGFLDGKHGLILNSFHAFYVFVKYAKAWEYKKSQPHS